MITEEMLRKAAAEAEEAMLSQLPEAEPHSFSPAFERRIQKLTARAKHPVRHQVLRYVAAVLLAILTLFGTVLAVSPEARATVSGWVESITDPYIHFSGDSPQSTVPEVAYQLTDIPDGYTLIDTLDQTNGKTYVYKDTSGFNLYFMYTCSGDVFLNVEGYLHQSASIHGNPADIYLSNKENETSTIVWQDRESNALFRIHAMADADELIAMAESVKKIK